MSSSTLVPVYYYLGGYLLIFSPINHAHFAFDKCVYICNVAVVRSSYITFLIHKKQFESQVYALRIYLLFQ